MDCPPKKNGRCRGVAVGGGLTLPWLHIPLRSRWADKKSNFIPSHFGRDS